VVYDNTILSKTEMLCGKNRLQMGVALNHHRVWSGFIASVLGALQ